MERIAPCRRFASTIYLFTRSALRCLVVAALVLIHFAPASQGKVKKYVLMINAQSHPGPLLVTNAILSALHSDPRFDVELYWENLDDDMIECAAERTARFYCQKAPQPQVRPDCADGGPAAPVGRSF